MDRPHDPVKAVTKKKETWRLNLVYKSQLSIRDVFPSNYVVIVNFYYQGGLDDPRDYPQVPDEIMERKFAFRVRLGRIRQLFCIVGIARS
jgi:hypothetical protein